MSEKQMVWHAFHAETLCQLVDLEARRQEIEEIKPEYELPTRRRLMKPVIGQLPPVFAVVCKARNEADKARDEAWKIYEYDEASKAWDEADRVYVKAEKVWDEAYELYKDEIESLHAEECPDCPWDGHTIFPE